MYNWCLITILYSRDNETSQAKFASNFFLLTYSKTCLNGHSQKDKKMVLKTHYRLMQVKSVSTFIKLPVVIKIFVLSFFEWPFYIRLTVHICV